MSHLRDELPLHSPVLGAAALTAVVATPYHALAVRAYRGDDRIDATAVAADCLWLAWSAVESVFVRERSWLVPVYATVGLCTLFAGRRGLRRG